MKIHVLGPGCAKRSLLAETVATAAKKPGIDYEEPQVKRPSFKTTIRNIVLAGCLLLASTAGSFAADSEEGTAAVPFPGKVTLLDLGAKKCLPCKMMEPILTELEKEYKDRAAIIFIDVWENPGASPKYGIQVIPTQIFYDAKGKEVLRHEGFMEKAAIIAELQKLGVK